jgi:hypothetical protein
MSNEFDLHVLAARKAFTAGDPPQAADALRRAARSADLQADDARLRTLLEMWVRAASALGHHRLAARCDGAMTLHNQALFDAGWELIEVGLHDVALPLLVRVNRLAPGSDVVRNELAVALLHTGDPNGACDVLAEPPPEDPETRLLLAECAMLAGRLELARAHVVAGEGTDRADLILGVLRRADRLGSLHARDLRGWHQALTGGVLLHRSPYGFDDGMNGRYAFTQDSPSRIRLGLDRAWHVCQAWDRLPKAVCGMPDASSRALALAASALWGLPLTPPGPGVLRIAYDLDRVDAHTITDSQQPGSLLHVHTACWTAPPSIAPDTLTLLHQVNLAPWDGGPRIDPGTRKVVQQPASTEPPDVWAERILDADPTQDEELPGDSLQDVVDFAKRVIPASGARRFWAGGPVPSSRFG